MRFIKDVWKKLFDKKNDELAATAVAQGISISNKTVSSSTKITYVIFYAIIIFIMKYLDSTPENNKISDSMVILCTAVLTIAAPLLDNYIQKLWVNILIQSVLIALSLAISNYFQFPSCIIMYSNTISVCFIITGIVIKSCFLS